jgi:hypothetical protein
MIDEKDRGRTAEALRALAGGEELARRRVWARVQQGIAEDRRRRKRRGWITGAGLGLVASLAIAAPVAWQSMSSSSMETSGSVSAEAVWEMLSSQPGASDDYGSLQEFVLSAAGEAQTGAR